MAYFRKRLSLSRQSKWSGQVVLKSHVKNLNRKNTIMKVLIKVILFLIAIIFTSVCQSREPKNLQLGDECKIPNQNKTRGICARRRDCSEYEELFNVTDLGVERLSFILRLDCGFDFETWSALVCCPKLGNSYKSVCFLCLL